MHDATTAQNIDDTLLTALAEALGRDRLRVGDDIPESHAADAAGMTPCRPGLLLLPRSTQEVSQALALCHAHGARIVVQGGMTGLAGGAHPQEGEIALSLERMRGIEEIDTLSGTLTAMAGTTLQEIQEAAQASGFFCGIDLGARGSCTIGGNIATNAGGNQVLRYGMARRNVLGLEAVLADGTVVTSLNKMLKNNAGYDWTQLFIGSEGTLGIVTRVVLGLHPAPRGVRSALCAFSRFEDVVTVLRRFDAALPGRMIVFEAMWREYLDTAIGPGGLSPPFPESPEVTLLIEAAMGSEAGNAAGDDASDPFTETLAGFLEEGLIDDALIAQSEADRARFWSYREAVYEFRRIIDAGTNFDVSIPIARLDEAVERLREGARGFGEETRLLVFGHVADSNIHISVSHPRHDAQMSREIQGMVYDIVAALAGSVSAEHGVGMLKRDYLHKSRSEAEIALMRRIKQALDPHNMLNPGRILA
ncbi:MAG: FAD-binding oxidoreductase [Salinarimonas sp.]|nr:FAD-binding oxidoreductase [Salinarimonas sp.]